MEHPWYGDVAEAGAPTIRKQRLLKSLFCLPLGHRHEKTVIRKSNDDEGKHWLEKRAASADVTSKLQSKRSEKVRLKATSVAKKFPTCAGSVGSPRPLLGLRGDVVVKSDRFMHMNGDEKDSLLVCNDCSHIGRSFSSKSCPLLSGLYLTQEKALQDITAR